MRRTITGDKRAERYAARSKGYHRQIANAFGGMEWKILSRISVAPADFLNDHYRITGKHAISQNIVELLGQGRQFRRAGSEACGRFPRDCVIAGRQADDASRVRMRDAPNQVDDGA